MPRRAPVLAFALGLVFFGALHALDPRLPSFDGYFHARYAALGPSAWTTLPWLPELDGWVDAQLLFHALIWPFTLIFSALTAVKIAATLFAAAALAAFTWLLGARGVARPLVWAVALLAASRLFDERLLVPRAEALAIALLLAGAGLALAGRNRALLVLGAVFVWTDSTALVLVPVATICGLSRFELKPGLAAAAGVTLGLTVHPNTPDTFTFLWSNVVKPVLTNSPHALGADWMPTDTRTWLTHVGPIGALALWALWRPSRPSADTRALALVALGGLVVSAFAVKWLVFAIPFALATVALMWRDGARATAWLWLASPLVLVNGASVLDHVRTKVPTADRLADLARALPADTCTVFHADWTDFSELVFHAPQCTYTVGLDPMLLASDSRRAALVDATREGTITRIGAMADEVFHAGWVVTTNRKMEERAKEDPRLKLVYLEDGAGLWRVVEE
jgi:hypothetical protein